MNLVCLDRFEAAAEILELVSLFVNLDSLPVVLHLRKHAVGALLHRHGDGAAGLGQHWLDRRHERQSDAEGLGETRFGGCPILTIPGKHPVNHILEIM